MFIELGEWCYVGIFIFVFGVKFGYGFGGVVGFDYCFVVFFGNCVLDNYLFVGFNVFFVKIGNFSFGGF